MDPEEISRLARKAKKKKKIQENTPEKPAYNPFDWMDFKRTRKWMGTNLALSDRFYSFVVWVMLAVGLSTWFYIQDGEWWAFYLMITTAIFFVALLIFGFIYGYRKAKRSNKGQ